MKTSFNRVSGENFNKIKNSGIDIPFEDVFNIPEDENIFHLDLEGKPVFDLPPDSIAVKKVFEILDASNIL
jgi:CO dehydrogenase nickel-insertion accessory protein CooC1